MDPQICAGWLHALEQAQAGPAVGVSHMMVARVWRQAKLRPHRIERYMASDDPDFKLKAAILLGCTSNRPSLQRCFASTKRPPSRPWTGSLRCYHGRRGDWSATASSTTVTAPFRCTAIPDQFLPNPGTTRGNPADFQ
jgi:hypothetical protein